SPPPQEQSALKRPAAPSYMGSIHESVDVPGARVRVPRLYGPEFPQGYGNNCAKLRDLRYLGKENRYVGNLYATDSRLIDSIGIAKRGQAHSNR
ncbi:MAG: hypothetical protein OXJ56_17205, partial [Rhodospirillaceae bacterium]|nr:hypothetical protein [Rhodospirillaceae bacterium]